MAPHVKRQKGHYRGGGAPKGNQNAKGNKGGTGRPSSYRVAFVSVARHVAALGGLDHQLADALGISVQTVRKWKQKYPDFAAACEVSDEEKLEAVKRSLYHRAIGYSHMGVKILSTPGGIAQVPFVEHFAPDVAAIKYFLGNKSKGEFVERVEAENSGVVSVRIEGGLPKDLLPSDVDKPD